MEKIASGVYRITLGTPEKFSFVSFREFPVKSVGEDHPAPFGEDAIDFRPTERGCLLSLPLRGEVYGFGLQLKAFRHTLAKRVLRCNADAPSASGESHAPVPFFVTTAGYGVLVDSARDVAFYCGEARLKGASRHFADLSASGSPEATDAAYRNELGGPAGRMTVDVPVAKGVEIYLFAGSDMLDAVQKYGMFCGGGATMPEWSLGVWYRMPGAYIAFTKFNYNKGIFGSPFIGWKNFQFLFGNGQLLLLLRNTVFYNLVFILLGNFLQVLLAILLNEVQSKAFKKATQSMGGNPASMTGGPKNDDTR